MKHLCFLFCLSLALRARQPVLVLASVGGKSDVWIRGGGGGGAGGGEGGGGVTQRGEDSTTTAARSTHTGCYKTYTSWSTRQSVRMRKMWRTL